MKLIFGIWVVFATICLIVSVGFSKKQIVGSVKHSSESKRIIRYVKPYNNCKTIRRPYETNCVIVKGQRYCYTINLLDY